MPKRLLDAAVSHLRSAFKGKRSKRVSLFVLDVLVVAYGLRPCFLNDYFFAEIDEVQRFLDAVKPYFPHLRCLFLAEDLYFYNHQLMITSFNATLQDRQFINIESTNQSPMFSEPAEVTLITSIFSDIYKSLIEPDVLIIDKRNWSRSPIITSISGILLGYPVVYTLGTHAHEPMEGNTSNCLAECPLTVFKVCGRLLVDVGKALGLGDEEYPIMSFSIPTSLYRENDGYEVVVRERFSGAQSQLFQTITVVKSNITLSCVVV